MRVPPVGSMGKAPGGDLVGFDLQKLTTLFVKNMLFYHGFKNGIAIFAFIAYNLQVFFFLIGPTHSKTKYLHDIATQMHNRGLNAMKQLREYCFSLW